jgi:nucleotide-binding universal stress UspA family protein
MKRFSSLLVGLDGSERSERAARQAIALARQSHGSVTLLHVGDHDQAVAAQHGRLRGHGVPVTYRSAVGDPAVELVAAAEAARADLVVLGTRGRYGAWRVLLGSVAEAVVRAARASVLVVRGDPVATGYERVLVGTDFSPCSAPALEQGMAVATDGAEVEVAHWWRPVVGDVGDVAATVAGRGQELIRRHASSRVRLGFHAAEGAPANALVERATLLDCDLVAVGAHSHDGLRRLLLGSVAEQVVRHAPCAVLVAR